MKKTILIVASLFSIATVVTAQELVLPKTTSTTTLPVKGKAVEHKVETEVKEHTEHVKGERKNEGHIKGGDHANKTPEQRAKQSVDDLNKKMNFSEDQKTKVYGLALDRANKVDVIKAKYKGTPENKATAKTEIEVVRKNYREQVRGLLTPEQLLALKEKRKAEGKGKGKPKTAGTETDLIDAGE